MNLVNSFKSISSWVIIGLIAALMPLIFDSYFALTLLSKMGVLVMFTVAYNMLLGQGGMLSFGHAIYFGFAGYVSVHVLNAIGEEFIPYFPIVLFPFIGAIVGAFLGYGIIKFKSQLLQKMVFLYLIKKKKGV